jgi:hypothetical protein
MPVTHTARRRFSVLAGTIVALLIVAATPVLGSADAVAQTHAAVQTHA